MLQGAGRYGCTSELLTMHLAVLVILRVTEKTILLLRALQKPQRTVEMEVSV